MREQTINSIDKNKLIAIMNGFSPDTLLYTVEALINGGVKSIETPFVSCSEKHERDSLKRIAALKKCFGKDITIGAGNVVTDRQMKLAKGAGADFVSSPNVCREVLERGTAVSAVNITGAFTASEIAAATSYGADFVKLFPSIICGSTEYAALMAESFRDTKLVASGNIGYNDITPLSLAGIKYFSVGGSLANVKLAEKQEYQIITNEAKRYVDLINSL